MEAIRPSPPADGGLNLNDHEDLMLGVPGCTFKGGDEPTHGSSGFGECESSPSDAQVSNRRMKHPLCSPGASRVEGPRGEPIALRVGGWGPCPRGVRLLYISGHVPSQPVAQTQVFPPELGLSRRQRAHSQTLHPTRRPVCAASGVRHATTPERHGHITWSWRVHTQWFRFPVHSNC